MSKISEEISSSGLGGVICQDGQYEKSLCFKEDFSGFNGHFPEQPVLPGIIIVQSALQAVSEAVGSIQLLEIQRTKFKGIVRPGDVLKIQWTQQDDEGILVCRCKAFVADKLVSSFNLKAVVIRGDKQNA